MANTGSNLGKTGLNLAQSQVNLASSRVNLAPSRLNLAQHVSAKLVFRAMVDSIFLGLYPHVF